MLDTLIKFVSAVVLLGVSVCFGFLSMSAEMGLSILAGALGLAFSNMDKISEFSGAGFSAKMKEQVEAVLEKEIEISSSDQVSEGDVSNSNEMKILKSLADPKFTWRTLKGIAKDTGLNENEIWATLTMLVANELARSANNSKTGEMIWSLTTLGRVKAA